MKFVFRITSYNVCYTKLLRTVIAFQYNDSIENLNNKIIYTSLKPNMFFKLFNIIVIEKYDVKYVQQKLLFENDWAWKTIVYGFSRDIDNIKYLKNNFRTVSQIVKSNRFISGTGVKINGGTKKECGFLNVITSYSIHYTKLYEACGC